MTGLNAIFNLTQRWHCRLQTSPNPINRFASLTQLLGDLSPENLGAVLAAFDEIPMRYEHREEYQMLIYAWAAFDPEAALKYVVYGAGAAGVMLYGISLIAGVLGTGDMGLLAERLRVVAEGGVAGLGDAEIRLVALGTMLVMVGLAFKLSLVPFHFWCPDAFEGASAEVGGFLSVASKAGAFGLLVRFCVALSGPSSAELMTAFGIGLGVIAMITMTFGNLAAYAQSRHSLPPLAQLRETITHGVIHGLNPERRILLTMPGGQPGDQSVGLLGLRHE